MRKLAITAALLMGLSACGHDAPPPAPTVTPPADEFDNLVRLDFPEDIQTVDHAAQYLLTGSGYQIDWQCGQCTYSNFLKDKPVSPLAFRPQQVTTLRRALVIIVGSEGQLIVNRDTKRVSLTLLRKSEIANEVS